MLFINVLQWWYGPGWSWALKQAFVVRLSRIYHFFSIGDLAKTLFAPFRQDALDTKRAPIGIKLQVFGGNIVSRVFGFFIRTILIIVGIFCLLAMVAVGVVWAVLWPLIPLGPFIAIGLTIAGVSL